MIIHLTHQLGGGTQKYIDNLIKLFPDVEHRIINQTPFNITDVDKIKLIHIHATMFGQHLGWDVLKLIDYFNNKEMPIYLTVHDYQWLFTINPAPSTEDFLTITPKTEDVSNCQVLFNSVTRIIFPTRRVYDNYAKYINIPLEKTHIEPHNDIPIRYQQSYTPKIESSINIAFVGLPSIHKGIREFYRLTQIMNAYYDIPIKYHLYGGSNVITTIVEHGHYNDDTLIETLHKDNIHIVLSISIAEETYCYSLSRLINSGLPIVYLNRGALTTRLKESPRFFPVNTLNMLELEQQIVNAIEYMKSDPEGDYVEMGNDIELTEYYKKNYI
jgi:hypothetical protein